MFFIDSLLPFPRVFESIETQYYTAATRVPVFSLLRCRVLRKLPQLAHGRTELSEPAGLCGPHSQVHRRVCERLTVQTGRGAADTGSSSRQRRAGRPSRGRRAESVCYRHSSFSHPPFTMSAELSSNVNSIPLREGFRLPQRINDFIDNSVQWRQCTQT